MTVVSTLSLPDQLERLAEMRTLPHGAQAHHHGYRSDCACSHVDDLVYQLRRVGLEPTDAAAYDQLTAVRSPRPDLGERGTRLLGLTAQEYGRRLAEESFTGAVQEQWSLVAGEGRRRLETELQESMRAEAGYYIAALQPAFEEAFDVFRQANELGITPGTRIEQAITLEPTALAMWRLLSSQLSAAILNALLGIRIRITTALQAEPGLTVLEREGYGVLVNCNPDVFSRYPIEGWQRWLAVAQASPAAGLAQDER